MRPDFADWIATLPLEELAVYFVIGLFGMVVHWGKKAVAGEVVVNPIDYFFKDHPWRTVGTVVAFAGTALGFVMTELMANMTWGQLVIQAFTAGLAANSLVNKGNAPSS